LDGNASKNMAEVGNSGAEIDIVENRNSPDHGAGNGDNNLQQSDSDMENVEHLVSNRFDGLTTDCSSDESEFVENTPVGGNVVLTRVDSERTHAAAVEGANATVADESLAHADMENADAAVAYDVVNPQVGNNSETPARIENDLKFLNDAWANMMEDEEAEIRALKELEKEHVGIDTNDGFQKVTKRKQKQKKTNAALKVYDTRSKGVPSNPSQ